MTDVTAERATYGNWIKARSPGLFGAGLLATVVLFVGLIAALIAVLLGGLIAAAVVVTVAALGFAAVGTPAGPWLARRVRFAVRKAQGGTVHQAGVLSSNPDPSSTLPQLLARTKLLTASDAFGSFVVLRRGGLYTMVAQCSAEGPRLQDQSRIDMWVARWAALLASLGQETGLVCLKAITDTAPDPGGRLPAMVAALRSPDSPPLARQIIDEAVAMLPPAASEITTYLELTYRGRMLNRKGNEAAILAELTRRARGLVPLAQYSGGGHVEMVTEPELARTVRVAYDPGVAVALEQEELAGGDLPPLTWQESGPIGARENWGDLEHGSGRSVTWAMTEPPRSRVTEHALTHLLAPHSDFARKRVALLLRPHGPGESSRTAERDARTATFLARQGKRKATAAAEAVQVSAEQSRREVAAGAASVRFSLMVTATVAHDGDLEQAVSTVEARARAVPVRLRRVDGDQAAAFAVTLPVGLVPWETSSLPSSVRDLM